MGFWPTFIVVLTFVANLLILVAVAKNNPRSWTNRLLVILTTTMALWTVTNYLALSPGTESVRLFWVRVVMMVTAPIGAATYLLALVFPEEKLNVSKRLLGFVVTTTVMGIIFARSMFVALFNTTDGGFTLIPGFAVVIFAFNHFGYTMAGLLVLIKKYKANHGRLKTQLGYVLAGLILTLVMITLTNFIAVVWFKTIQYTFIGPVTTLFQVGFVAYAIIRHQFLDIRAVAARAVTYTLLLLTVVAIETSLVVISAKLLPIDIDPVYVAAFGAIIIVLGYDILRGVLSRVTERIFFQGRYNTEDVLAKLTHTMATTIEIKPLSQKLIHILMEDLKVAYGAFVLFKDGGKSQIESVNWVNSAGLKDVLWDDMLEGKEMSFVFEDIRAESLKSFFREQEISVALRLIIKNKEIGLLLLGPKASGEIYSAQDLELLSIFAPQAAIALNNARAYQEIQQFSKTLEKKVDERTEELKESQRERLARAKELLRIKDEFVFIATHDLATPVTALRGYVEMLQNINKKLPKDVKFDIDAIGEATERLKALVEDLLQVARGESGTIKVELAKVNLVDVINDAVEIVAQRAKDKKVKFVIDLDKRAGTIMADDHKLREVVENLFTNAVKYNKEGGKVAITTKREGDKVVVTVADTGIGIPESEQMKVFTKFYRSDSSEVRNQTGTGLGLFVVKMLVSKMKGTIEFVSKEGEGTTFTLTFVKG